MENEKNVVSLEDYKETTQGREDEADSVEETVTTGSPEENNEESNEENEPTPQDINNMVRNVAETLKNIENTVKVMENQWLYLAKEFKVTDTQMKELGKWISDHRTELPDDASEEEKKEWDPLNGINSITIEEITQIFGEDSPIHGMSEEITKDHVKEVCNTYFSWLMIMREYRESHDAYLELLEVQEETNLEILKVNAEKEEDPEKKSQMLKSIDSYYNYKYLGFFAEPLPEKELARLLKTLKDEKKCVYWINRTRDKLDQYKVSQKFIMEIAGFEKKYEADYSSVLNIVLLYFMNTCIHSDAHDKKDPNNTKTFSMVIALNNVIRNVWKDDKKQRVMDNVEEFIKQFVKYKEEHPEA